MKSLGLLLLLLGIILFSTIELCQKFIVAQCGEHIDPYIIVILRFTITGLLLLAIGLPLLKRQHRRVTATDWLYFLINGIVGITICLSFFHYGIDLFTNASSAAVVFSANAVYVVILARFINDEPWTLGKWLAMLIGLTGISFFVFEKGTPDIETLKALGVMSLSALLFAFSVCFTKRTVARCGAMVYMGGSSIIGGLLALPVFFALSDKTFMQAVEPISRAIPSMTYFVLVATAFAYWVYYIGLSKTSAFHASMAFMLKPVLACALAQLAVATGLIASERPMNAWTYAGATLIIVAMLLAQLSARKVAHK